MIFKFKPLPKQIMIKILRNYAQRQNVNINSNCLELIYYYNCYLLDINCQGVRTALNFLDKVIYEHTITSETINKHLLKTILIRCYNVKLTQLDDIDKYLLEI